MLTGKFGKGLAMLLSAVLIVGTVWVSDVNYVKADEGPADGDMFLTVSAGGARGDGQVQYKIGDGEWTVFSEPISKDSIVTGEETSKSVSIKVIPDGGSTIAQAKLRYNDGEADRDVDMSSDITSDGGYTFTYSSSNIYEVFVEFDMNAGGVAFGSWGESGSVTIEYRIGTEGDFTGIGSGESIIPSISSGDIYLRVVPGANTRITNANINIDGTDNPIASSDYSKLEDGSYHFSYTQTSTYDLFFGYEEVSSTEATIEIDDSAKRDSSQTRGTFWYSTKESGDETGDWTQVTGDGIPATTAKRVKITYTDSKYKLKSNWDLVIPGKGEGDSVYDDFRNAINNGSVATLTPGYSYKITNICIGEEMGTFLWKYNSPAAGDDNVVGGTIEIVGATYNGTPQTSATEACGPGGVQNIPFWSNTRTDGVAGGEGCFKPGTIITIKLVPDRGYQLTQFTINGAGQTVTTNPQTSVSTFTFTVPNANFHLGAKFTPKSDEVKSSATGISGGTVGLATSEFSNGTAALMVENAAPANTSAFETRAEAGGYTVDQYIDLKVQNIFYKGNTTDYWASTPKTELSTPATITLNASNISGGEVEIIHEHNGSYEVIPATYNNGKITFQAQTFSNFAIVSKGTKKPASTPTVSEENKENKSEEVTPVVQQPAALGTVSGGETVKTWDDVDKILANKNLNAAKTSLDKKAAKEPVILTLNQNNATVPESTIQALQKSDVPSLHLMMGNGASITISNGSALKNQGPLNLSNKVTQTASSKTIAFATNAKLKTVSGIHMSVPKNVKEAKLFYVINGQKTYLGTFKSVNGQVLFPIMQLGTYQLIY